MDAANATVGSISATVSSPTQTTSSTQVPSPSQPPAGYVAGAAPIDVGLMSSAFAIASLLFLFMSWKLVTSVIATARSSGRTRSNFSGGDHGFVIVAFCASACNEFKSAVALTYAVTFWLEPRFRYFCVNFVLYFSMALLYFLYERRLALLFANTNRIASLVFGLLLKFLLLFYIVIAIVVTVYFMSYAKHTASGGYTSAPPQAWYLRSTIYAADIAIGVVILSGTFVALLAILQTHRDHSSQKTPFFKVVLGSDCLKFIFIAAIEAYKLANASDPANLLGALPTGNNGFQHLIDNVKMALMTASLFAPVVVVKIVETTSLHKAKSSNGLSGGLSLS